MMLKSVLVVLMMVMAATATATAEEKVSYDGFSLVEMTCSDGYVATVVDAYTLAFAKGEGRVLMLADDAERCVVGRRTLVLASAVGLELIQALAGTDVVVQVADLGALIAENEAAAAAHPYVNYAESANEYFEAYREWEEIEDYFDGLCAAHASVCTRFSIGTSYQGRDLFGYRVTAPTTHPKPTVLYNGLIHAREWIAGHALQYTLDHFVRGAGNSSILDNVVLEIIPVLNPDGYVYTRTTNNMWRKSRMPTSNPACVGTDLNRNWEFEWCTVGASTNPCSDSYCGSAFYDNPETAAIGEYIAANSDHIAAHMDWHSYMEVIMSPWGCYSSLPDDYPLMEAVMAEMAAAIASVRGTRYTYGSISHVIYLASGSSVDTSYALFDMPLSLAYEIGKTFQPPVSEIIPTGMEMVASTTVHLQAVYEHWASKQNTAVQAL